MRAEVDEEEALIALRRLPESGVDSVLARFFATRKLYALRRMLNDKQQELPF